MTYQSTNAILVTKLLWSVSTSHTLKSLLGFEIVTIIISILSISIYIYLLCVFDIATKNKVNFPTASKRMTSLRGIEIARSKEVRYETNKLSFTYYSPKKQ